MRRLAIVWALLCRVALADDLAAAREHYHKGVTAYEVGDFDEAIREFSASYKLKDDPTILFNLAQSHRFAHHRDEALRSYRIYLQKVPDAANRDEVEKTVAELQKGSGMEKDEDPDTERARRHFRVGAEHYSAGRYAEL
jgi:tetratricopeptide (TPR) repeat protein